LVQEKRNITKDRPKLRRRNCNGRKGIADGEEAQEKAFQPSIPTPKAGPSKKRGKGKPAKSPWAGEGLSFTIRRSP